jgi:hypothetical protein
MLEHGRDVDVPNRRIALLRVAYVPAFPRDLENRVVMRRRRVESTVRRRFAGLQTTSPAAGRPTGERSAGYIGDLVHRIH